jgi:RyR domain
MTDLSVEQIAKIAMVCHETNRAYCQAQGDNSQPLWVDAPAWQRASAIKSVEFGLEGHTPEESHESWLREKKRTGWMYGEMKDPDAQPPTHPCILPYDELPPEQRVKDHLFMAIVSVLGRGKGAGLFTFEQVQYLLLAEREGRNQAIDDRNAAVRESGDYRNGMYEALAKRAGNAERMIETLGDVDKLHRELKGAEESRRLMGDRLLDAETILSSPWRLAWTLLWRFAIKPARTRYARRKFRRKYPSITPRRRRFGRGR